ncbi:ribonuclease domain-containing protein [Streptomyces sp. NPDC001073]|uniref:ribonuclease domain-containing protein n=1 Tax=Streptomyces sp. NPDC001642 TaxID=3154392 RepID=UPI00331955F4
MLLRFVSRVLLVLLAVLLPVGCSSTATTGAGTTATGTVELSQLPAEARRTVALIDRGGPFPYAKDGVVFGNYEKLLPRQKRGFYHEYTVRTPGSRDRGARRIVTGQDGKIYYTDDHYKSFRTVLR